MDKNWVVGYGFDIVSIKSSSALVDAYLLDTPVILLLSRGNYNVSAIRLPLVLLTCTVWKLQCSISGPKCHPSTLCGSKFILCYGLSSIKTLVPGGARGVLLK